MSSPLVDLVDIMYPKKKSTNSTNVPKNPPPKVGMSWGRPTQVPKPNQNPIPNKTIQQKVNVRTELSEYMTLDKSDELVQDTYTLIHSRR